MKLTTTAFAFAALALTMTPMATADETYDIMEKIAHHIGETEFDLDPSADLIKDLGFDELDLMEVQEDLEETFGLDMPDLTSLADAETGDLTVQTIVDYVEAHTPG